MLSCGFHLLKSIKQRRPPKNRHGGAYQDFPPLQYKVKNSPEKVDNPRGNSGMARDKPVVPNSSLPFVKEGRTLTWCHMAYPPLEEENTLSSAFLASGLACDWWFVHAEQILEEVLWGSALSQWKQGMTRPVSPKSELLRFCCFAIVLEYAAKLTGGPRCAYPDYIRWGLKRCLL